MSLDRSNLVSVTVSLEASSGTPQSVNSLLVLTDNTVIDSVERMRGYSSLSAVGIDFGTSSEAFGVAEIWFGIPNPPDIIYIGLWAATATAGRLIGGSLSAAQQAISNFNTISDGGFTITFDGASAPLVVTGVDLTLVTNLNAVASDLTTAIGGGRVVVWDANNSRFTITSSTTGATSSVSFASPPTAGTTDLSGLMGLTATFSGAYAAPGLAVETPLQAAVIFDAMFGQLWYAMKIPDAANADQVAVGQFLAGTRAKHFLTGTTIEAGALVASNTTDLGSLTKAAGLTKTAIQYSSSTLYADASIMAQILTVNYTANDTAINTMWQSEPGVVAESLNQQQSDTLKAKNLNVLALYNDGSDIYQYGTTADGNFIDIVIGGDALGIAVQQAVFAALKTAGTKIAQTDAGMALLTHAVENVCLQFKNAGWIAPGQWNGPVTFGTLTVGQTLDKGYYVYAAPVDTQPQTQRSQRIAVPIQVAVKLAGAINTASVAITVEP